MLQRQLDRDHGQVIEEFFCLLVCDIVFELRVNNAPKCSLLRDPCTVLRVQERDVKHFLRIITTVIADVLVLEVGMLHVTMLLELLNIDLRLSYSCHPAIIRQCNAVAKTFDRALENFVLYLLDLKLLLKVANEILLVSGLEPSFTTWSNVSASFAEVAPIHYDNQIRHVRFGRARLTC